MRLIGSFFLALSVVWTVTGRAIPAEGHKIMISAASPYAIEAGRKAAARGGNVVDVAVVVALTEAVTTPYYAALGGGGFALVKMNEVVDALDFRETAPAATGKDYYLKLDSKAAQTGGRAVGVPGIPAGLWALHQKYGKLKWTQLFEEPLSLASRGFAVSGEWVAKAKSEHDRFNRAGLVHLFRSADIAYKPGEILKQPWLTKALEELQRKNVKGFYEGAVAKDLVDTVHATGGAMTLDDLKKYKVRWLSPLTTEYEGNKIYLMPPPSSGGVLIFTGLHMLEKLGVKNKGALSADEYHLIGEIEARIFRGRVLLGDPDFNKNPVAYLTSDKYIEELVKSVKEEKATTLEAIKPGDIKEGANTTHLSVMDNEGHAVAMTVTLNDNYGSAVVTEKYGIALNDEMDDFTTRPGEPNLYGLVQGEGNMVEPGKRPLSSMSPALVEKHGKVIMAVGSPGGPRIISGVLQVLYRILGRGVDPDTAIQTPRVHHQFVPDTLYVDRGRFAPEVVKSLRDRGHRVEESGMGKVFVVRLRDDGILEGAYDSRGEGAAGGI
jgi:gamma-glutamyltranspeptidase/glutathione hydrolase